jgi:hypothetical protein
MSPKADWPREKSQNMGQFSVEIYATPGQFSVKINTITKIDVDWCYQAGTIWHSKL